MTALVKQYQLGSACISSSGATAMDKNALQLYSEFYKGLYQSTDCQAAFTGEDPPFSLHW